MLHTIGIALLALGVFSLLAEGKLGDAIVGLLTLVALLAVAAFFIYLPIAVFVIRDKETTELLGSVLLIGMGLIYAWGLLRWCVQKARGGWPQFKAGIRQQAADEGRIFAATLKSSLALRCAAAYVAAPVLLAVVALLVRGVL